jgi:radical SAM protein with 4Fe4S-binding SPASM domain
VDWFVTYNYLPSGRGTADLDLDTGQKDELWSNLFEEARHCSKTRWLSFAPQLSVFGKILGGKTSLSPTHYYEPIFTEDYQTMLKASTACMAGRYYLGIKADGRVVPCIFLPEEVGNVRDQKLADLWNRSPILINLRDRDKIKGICRDCAYGASCGGCRARARAYTGDYMASDPQCPVPERLALYTKAVHGADLKGYSHK